VLPFMLQRCAVGARDQTRPRHRFADDMGS
jgi:hypothetical protein